MMNSCETCSSKRCFCPVTVGLALGLTCALGVLFISIWAICCGLPAGLEGQMLRPVPGDWSAAAVRAVWALIKGFIGGFVFAMIYNFLCCLKSKCCGKCNCCKK